jgi:hypothetical protein
MRIITVEDKKDMQRQIENYIQMGYSLKMQTDSSATVVKRSYGSALLHILLLLFTAGLGNLFYLFYAYTKSDEVLIKME